MSTGISSGDGLASSTVQDGISAGDGLAGPGGAALDLDFTTGTLNPIVTYTGGDNGTYFDSSGILQTSGSDEPRFDHDSGTPLGLLIEKARTNHFLNSGTPATQTSGALATGEHTLWMVGTGSVAVAANSATITGAGTATDGSPVTFDVTVGGTVDYTVTGSPTRAQSEKGSFATSYIPTAGSSVTRTADIATIAVSNIPGFSDAIAHTFYLEYRRGPTEEANSGILQIDDGTNNNHFRHNIIGAPTCRTSFKNAPAGEQIHFDHTTAVNTTYKFAWAVAEGDQAGSLDGAAVETDTDVGLPTSEVTTLRLGNLAGNFQMNGHIMRFVYWSERLPDARLQSLTA